MGEIAGRTNFCLHSFNLFAEFSVIHVTTSKICFDPCDLQSLVSAAFVLPHGSSALGKIAHLIQPAAIATTAGEQVLHFTL